MRSFVRFIALIAALFIVPLAAQAKVRIAVDLSSQRMDVQSDSGASYSWPISSARAGYVTPRGAYHPISLQTMHHSKKYHNSPMPHSIFFKGGYAIHGTYAVGALGRPASHGCIRISPANAATLFSLVRAEGAIINITGSAPVRQYAQHQGHHASHVHFVRHDHYAPSALGYAPIQHRDGAEKIFRNILTDW